MTEPQTSQPFDNDYCGYKLIKVCIVFLVLDALFIALRVAARSHVREGWGHLDDWLMLPAWICNIGVCALGICFVEYANVGYHEPTARILNPDSMIHWAKGILALVWIYVPACCFPKFSILALYLRIFRDPFSKAVTWTLIVMISVYWVTYAMASLFQCVPIQREWDSSIPGHCFDSRTFYRLSSLPNIITDVPMLLLPMPTVWSLHASVIKKVGLTLIFVAGGAGLVASCIRLSVFFRNETFTDNTWASVSLLSWSIIEPSAYLIASCSTTLRPLFVAYTPQWIKEHFHTYVLRDSQQSSSNRMSSTTSPWSWHTPKFLTHIGSRTTMHWYHWSDPNAEKDTYINAYGIRTPASPFTPRSPPHYGDIDAIEQVSRYPRYVDSIENLVRSPLPLYPGSLGGNSSPLYSTPALTALPSSSETIMQTVLMAPPPRRSNTRPSSSSRPSSCPQISLPPFDVDFDWNLCDSYREEVHSTDRDPV